MHLVCAFYPSVLVSQVFIETIGTCSQLCSFSLRFSYFNNAVLALSSSEVPYDIVMRRVMKLKFLDKDL